MVLASGDCVQLAVLADLGAREALGAHALHELLELVALGAREVRARPGRRIALTISAGRSRRYAPLLNFSAIALKNGTPPPPCSMTSSVRSTCSQAEAQVRLVVAVLRHRLVERHAAGTAARVELVQVDAERPPSRP